MKLMRMSDFGGAAAPASSLLQALSNLALNTARDGAATASLGTLCLCLSTLTGKNFCLRAHLNLPSGRLKPFPLSCPYRPFGNSCKERGVSPHGTSTPLCCSRPPGPGSRAEAATSLWFPLEGATNPAWERRRAGGGRSRPSVPGAQGDPGAASRIPSIPPRSRRATVKAPLTRCVVVPHLSLVRTEEAKASKESEGFWLVMWAETPHLLQGQDMGEHWQMLHAGMRSAQLKLPTMAASPGHNLLITPAKTRSNSFKAILDRPRQYKCKDTWTP
ncbi:uncharacterized protein ACIB01_015955 [Guaruba guarouba]